MNAPFSPLPSKDPGIERLTGSSAPTGTPPSFQPIATSGDVVHDPAPSTIDPVFAAIEAHRAAYDAWRATGDGGVDLQSEGPLVEAERAALDTVGEVTPQTVNGLKAWVDYLSLQVEQDGCWAVAERALPRINAAIHDLVHVASLSSSGHGSDAERPAERDPIFAALAEHKRAFDALIPLCGVQNNDEIKPGWNAADAAEVGSLNQLVGTIPESMDGLTAFCRYLSDHLSKNEVREGVPETAIATIAAACEGLAQRTPSSDWGVSDLEEMAAATTVEPSTVRTHEDVDLLALAAELERLEIKIAPLRAAYNASPTSLDVEKRYDDADDVIDEVMRRIANEPASTLDGLAAKARAIDLIYYDERFTCDSVPFIQGDTVDVALSRSIVSDLVNLVRASSCSGEANAPVPSREAA